MSRASIRDCSSIPLCSDLHPSSRYRGGEVPDSRHGTSVIKSRSAPRLATNHQRIQPCCCRCRRCWSSCMARLMAPLITPDWAVHHHTAVYTETLPDFSRDSSTTSRSKKTTEMPKWNCTQHLAKKYQLLQLVVMMIAISQENTTQTWSVQMMSIYNPYIV